MPDDDTAPSIAPPEGLAGGPGPTPPGFDDGTPKPLEGGPAGSARSGAGEPNDPKPRVDPEEPDPS